MLYIGSRGRDVAGIGWRQWEVERGPGFGINPALPTQGSGAVAGRWERARGGDVGRGEAVTGTAPPEVDSRQRASLR